MHFKKLVVWAFAGIFFLVVAALAAIQTLAPEKIKELIQEKGSALPAREVRVARVGYSIFKPFEMELHGLSVSDSELGLKAELPETTVRTAWGFAEVFVDVLRPSVQYEHRSDRKTAESKAKPASDGAATRPFALHFRIQDGALNASAPASKSAVTMKNLGLGLDWQRIDAPWRIFLKADQTLTHSGSAYPLPVELDLALEGALGDTLVFKGGRLKLAGIPISFSGSFQPATGRGQAAVQASIADLSALSGLSPKLASSKLTGAFSTSIQAKNETGQVWKVSGDLQAKAVRGELKWEGDGASLDGPVALDADARFAYDGLAWSSPGAALTLSLDSADVKWKDSFRKPRGTRLTFDLNGATNGKDIDVKSAKLLFAQIDIKGSGKVASAPGERSAIELQLAKTSLAGLEASFPALAGVPLRGMAEASASVRGDLSQPESLSIDLHPVVLKDVTGGVNWASNDGKTRIQGPASLDAKIDLKADGKILKTADISASADLTRLSIRSGDAFEKKAGAALLFSVNAKQKGESIQIQSSQLKLLSSVLTLQGKLSQPQKPVMDLSIGLKSFDYAELASVLPPLRKSGLRGKGSAALALKGTYDFKDGIEKSPLRIAGSFKSAIQEYAAAPSKPPSPAPSNPAASAEPMLPNWPVLRTADLKTDISLERYSSGAIRAEKIRSVASLKSGLLSGAVRIGSVFGGSLDVREYKISLVRAQPDITTVLDFSGIRLEAMAAAFSPEWAALASGAATGKASLLIPDSKRADFVDALQARGEMKVKQANVSTNLIQAAIQEKLSKIPGLADRAPVKLPPVRGDLDSKFVLKGGKLAFESFDFAGADRNDLKMAGWIGFDKSVDLNGTASLSQSPVKGPILKANSDAQGRLVVPLTIQGDLMQPSIGIAQKTIETMLARTVESEARSKAAELKSKAESEVKKKAGDVVQDQIKKKLPGLFR